jgi:hypothetical protein
VLTTFGLSEKRYRLNQLRYDLRKLKEHDLLERDGTHYAYRLTTASRLLSCSSSLISARAVPSPTAASTTNPTLNADPIARSKAAYHRADAPIQKVVDLIAAA